MKFKALLVLHLIALHSSIAGMELFSWLTFLVVAASMVLRRERPLAAGPDWWMAGFALIAGLGLLFAGVEAKSSLYQFGFLRWMLLLYSFAYAWTHSELMRSEKIAWIWGALAAIAGLYAFFQFVTGIDFIRPHKALSPAGARGFRATGFFSMSLTLAYVLGISGAFLLAHLRGNRRWPVMLFFLACILMGLFASLSRGSWIAFSAVVFVFGLQEWGKKAFWGLVPAGVIFGLLFSFEPEFRYRILDLFNTQAASSSGERLDIWRGYWQVFLDHPLIGAGLFNGDELLPGIYQRLGIVQPFVSHAHNNYLQALAGTGSLGFLCFVAFNVYFLRAAHVIYRQAKDVKVRRLAQGAFLAQVFWQLGGLTECNFFDGEVNHNIIFMWALVIALRSQKVANEKS